ncbi:MAG: hypothetical protein D6723_12360, partial [Acidobacteria bacterium]
MMNERMAIFCALGFLLVNVLGAKGDQRPSVSVKGVPSAVPIIRLDEIEPGMEGTIRTVFQGDAIEEFGFRVLGILPHALGPRQDVILVRLTGPKPTYTGVVAGMSGSPAYIDGRLAGALSLRFGLFTKEPIAGITPIESMLQLMQMEAEKHLQKTGQWRTWSPDAVKGNADRGVVSATQAISTAGAGEPRLLEPIPSPLFFGGFRQQVIDWFAPLLERYHLKPITIGGGGAAGWRFRPERGADLVPGAPVAAVLVAGDLSVYATGTVSYRDGERVLAFGHPFFQLGTTDMPMATAEILTTVASEMSSFKIARLGDIVGTVRQDRLTAIMGLIGVEPNLIPINVEVISPARGHLSYHYRILRHPTLAPLLLNFTLANSILLSVEQSDELTVRYDGVIHLEGHPAVRIHDMVTSSDVSLLQPVPLVVAERINASFARLYNNGLERPNVRGLDVTFTLSEERRSMTIEELRVSKRAVHPGDDIDVYAILRPYRGPRVIKTFRLKIPESVRPDERLTLMVADARTLRALEHRGMEAGSLNDLITILNRERPSDHLYVRLSERKPGYVVHERLLPSLPLSVISVMGSDRTASQAARID